MPITELDPTAEVVTPAAAMAPPLRSLAGKTIGLLDNGKVNVGGFLDHVEAILRAEHGVAAVLRRRKPNVSAPAPAELLAELVVCDAVVSAVGD
jgi:hypothetical protein